MNPCPCGWYTDPRKECHCSSQEIQRYLSKISGPLLDRIDIHLDVPALKSTEFLEDRQTESSGNIKKRTGRARQIQQERFKKLGFFANAQMNHRQIKEFCRLEEESRMLLKKAIEELELSARSYDKILKIARTIADLDEQEEIQVGHIAEAIQYRSLDRNWWG